MELKDYFEFVNNETIRVSGTRVGVETVLRDYQEGASPEELVLRYPTLSLEQVHATITYYLANRQEVDSYLERVRHRRQEGWREQQSRPSEFVLALRERLVAQRRALHRKKKDSTSQMSRSGN
jgi:uncharacterized protein (DUF433 family)